LYVLVSGNQTTFSAQFHNVFFHIACVNEAAWIENYKLKETSDSTSFLMRASILLTKKTSRALLFE